MLAGGTDSASRGDDLAALKEALDQSLEVRLSCLSAVELAERACELERLSARFEALRLCHIGGCC